MPEGNRRPPIRLPPVGNEAAPRAATPCCERTAATPWPLLVWVLAGASDSVLVPAHAVTAFGRGQRIERKHNGKGLRRIFLSACRVLGKSRCANLTIHHGRHTCASQMLAGGVDAVTVHHMLGHRSLSRTTVYAHVLVDEAQPITQVFG